MNKKRQEILNYLQGPRRYMDGVALYAKYGGTNTMVQTFNRQGVTKASQAMLMEELRKISGITESEFKAIRQMATTPSLPKEKIIFVKKKDDGEEKKIPETAIKVVKFREKFPFLKEDDCPDVLKILVADLFTAYAKYKEAHEKLANMPDDADAIEAKAAAEEVVENFLNNRDIWEELEYYQENHQLLGKCKKAKLAINQHEISDLSDMELVQKRNSAAAQISKAKGIIDNKDASEEKKAKAMETLEKWTIKKEALDAEIEGRKKN